MRGSASVLFLQVWVTLWSLSQLQGKVLAPSQTQAGLGHSVMLVCNISMETGEALKQVLWIDKRNETILHYQPDQHGQISKVDGFDLALQQTGQKSHTSVITVQRARPGTEGCYQCLFDVFPTGQQRGKTCLSLTASVESLDNTTVFCGKPVALSCKYTLSKQVHQVLWKKTAEQGDTSIVASYSKYGGPKAESPFWGRVTLNPSFGHTKLFIHQTQTEDEGCYTCEFHTYPDGIKSSTICLLVYVLPKPEVSLITAWPGVMEANCTAVSRPAAEISWNVEGHNLTLGPALTSLYQLGDGTVVVVSSIQMQAELLEVKQVKCKVHHQGLRSPIVISLNESWSGHIVLVLFVAVALVLLVCLCICLKRC